MKKILLLLLCIFTITGCKVEYNLVINNDLSITETVNMTGTDQFFENFYKSSRLNVINMMLDKERKDFLNQNNYEFKIVEGNNPFVVASKKYNNLSDFSNNTIFYKQYFENLDIIESNGIVSFNATNFIPIGSDSLERYDIKNSSISIKLPYKVIENNASKHDLKTNTYTWYIDDETNEFSINLKYNQNEIYSPPVDGINWTVILIFILFTIGVIIVYIVNKKNIK